MSKLMNAAFDYHAEGFSVIPIQARDKRPLIGWEDVICFNLS